MLFIVNIVFWYELAQDNEYLPTDGLISNDARPSADTVHSTSI